MKYVEFNDVYIADSKLKIHAERSGAYQVINIPGVEKPWYLTKRVKEEANITRMEMLYPSSGEIWYLRVILQNRPCSSYEDARTYQV
jgi:hypothetical protein